MMARKQSTLGVRLEQFSSWATLVTGSTQGFAVAALMIVVWLLSGPSFQFSDTWQLVMNTITSIVTFLMVFLIQRSQNKESLAVQLKLNELVAAVQGASNRLIDVEDLSEDELHVLRAHFKRLVDMSKKDADLLKSHSVEEAQVRHSSKIRPERKRALPKPAE
jgi:low affinity Fe/Cu permease